MGKSNKAPRWRALQVLCLGMYHLTVSVYPSRGGAVSKRRVQQTDQSIAPTLAKPASAAFHMNGAVTIAQAGPFTIHFPHDGNTHRIRPLFHRLAGPSRPMPGPLGTRSHRSASDTRCESSPEPDALRSQRSHGEDVLQYPRHLRRPLRPRACGGKAIARTKGN